MGVISSTASTEVHDRRPTADQEPTVRELLIKQITWEANDTHSITFVDPTGIPLPSWKPGAHLSLRLPNGITREYSLCSDPSDTTSWTVAVLRSPDSRGGSSFVHEQLSVGAVIEVDGPRNNFELEDAGSYVLIAGGIGITPIISMARELYNRGANWSILYAGRTRNGMAFLDEVNSFPAHMVTVHVDDEAEGQFADIAGTVADLPVDAQVYVCGPNALMDIVAESMTDETQLRLERFKAPEPVVVEGEENSFEVIAHSTGQRIFVGPDITILDALAEAGFDMPSSCLEGICGSCETTVISGDVDHRDYLLSDEEKETSMCPCVSRCKSAELVLDI